MTAFGQLELVFASNVDKDDLTAEIYLGDDEVAGVEGGSELIVRIYERSDTAVFPLNDLIQLLAAVQTRLGPRGAGTSPAS